VFGRPTEIKANNKGEEERKKTFVVRKHRRSRRKKLVNWGDTVSRSPCGRSLKPKKDQSRGASREKGGDSPYRIGHKPT